MKITPGKRIATIHYDASEWSNDLADVIEEKSVSLLVNNMQWLTFMCTPTNLEELAVGFLFNEGIIQELSEVASVKVCSGADIIDVWLNRSVEKPEKWIRTSGCSGGTTSVERLVQKPRVTISKNGVMLSPGLVGDLMCQLHRAQALYKQTGGVHTSAMSDGEKILVSAEDIGRHNTLDKLAGCCLRLNISPKRRIILTTGRISSEMIQKGGRIGASVVISRTSPSSLSIQMADWMGITLIGYARRECFTIYAHPERVFFKPSGEKTLVRQNDE